jgi:hypothetical protein
VLGQNVFCPRAKSPKKCRGAPHPPHGAIKAGSVAAPARAPRPRALAARAA